QINRGSYNLINDRFILGATNRSSSNWKHSGLKAFRVVTSMLVQKINVSIGQDPESKCLIGVLDIYGFESFKNNRYLTTSTITFSHNMHSNMDNVLQHVFKMEQERYTKEGIDWSYLEFVDNQDVLDLIEKKPGGIIALLDEACYEK
ncbi:hypothetical protein S245_056103, partial [Arachis hypogaea]